ncbi:MAG: ubiquinol-cytochrome C chaperone family protein [Cognaticolwellia sp.]
MNNTSAFDSDLNPLLCIASDEDLAPLVEYLKDKFSESLTDSSAYKAHSPSHSKYADVIAEEIRYMGGNSLLNVIRSKGPAYHEIACDVADKIGANFNKKNTVESVEDAILEKILTQAVENMTEAEKQALYEQVKGAGAYSVGGLTTAAFIMLFRSGGFSSYQLAMVVANYVARLLLGHGLILATNATIAKVLSVVTGPVGLAISGAWTAIDLAGPAYKVTIPCVIHIAFLRKKLNSLECGNCKAILNDNTMKFCPECGSPLQGKASKKPELLEDHDHIKVHNTIYLGDDSDKRDHLRKK